MKLPALLPLSLLLAACQTAPVQESSPRSFAQAACGTCHAVEEYAISPDGEAPPFASIANREGLTADTLETWLRDAHNYPEQMNFTLEDRHLRQLVAHIMTLQREDYRPLP